MQCLSSDAEVHGSTGSNPGGSGVGDSAILVGFCALCDAHTETMSSTDNPICLLCRATMSGGPGCHSESICCYHDGELQCDTGQETVRPVPTCQQGCSGPPVKAAACELLLWLGADA